MVDQLPQQMDSDERCVHISAIICTYRRPDTLPAAIASLMTQSLPSSEYEVIVVDNDEQGSAWPVMQRFVGEAVSNFRYVREQEQGLSHARNRGVREASGEIVAFLDDDAVAGPDWLASILRHISPIRPLVPLVARSCRFGTANGLRG